jgi:pyruvate, orthophosphate dikinase
MANQSAIVRKVAEEVFAEKGTEVEYLVGTMIELPRACLVADEIAKDAEFFSSEPTISPRPPSASRATT